MSGRFEANPAGLAGPVAMRGTGRALALLLLLAQALALVHLGTAPHVIEPGTGRVVHAMAELPDDAPASPKPQTHHDVCAVYAAFTQAATSASSASTVLLLLPSSTGALPLPSQEIPPWRRALHRLSPSHSPPAAA